MIVTKVPIADLKPDPGNARTHGPENLATITDSLTRWGQIEPLIVRRSDRVVVAGNGRLEAMNALGWTEAEIVELDLTEAQTRRLSIQMNRSSELSTWSEPMLAKTLADLRADGDLIGVGFESLEIDEKLGALGLNEFGEPLPEGTGADAMPAPLVAASRLGDLWFLGRHRLLCGDSASAADVDRLLAGAPIHLLNLDCPYNVKVEPRSNNAIAAGLSSFTGTTHHQGLDLARHPSKANATTAQLRAKDRPLINDFVSDEEFHRLLRAWFGNASRVLLPGRGFYLWGGYGNLGNYPPAIAESGLYFSQAIVWDKGHPVLTRKDYMGAFEIAFYGWKEGAAHQYFGPNNATDLWAIKKVNPQSMIHLTEKPVELAIRAMEYSSRLGENVLDLFGGSGSTLIAAEQTGRNAFLMELDGPYCDVIVSRFERTTGKSATLGPDGPTWDEVRAKRVHTSDSAPTVVPA